MSKNVIYVARASDNCPPEVEAKAGAAGILPGNVLMKSAGAFVVHNVAGQGGAAYFANLNSAAQEGVDDAYADGDTVNAFEPSPHQYYNLRIAAGENITAADTALTSDGAGALVAAATDGTEEVLAYADEIGDFSGAGGLLRCKVGNFGYNADTTA